MCYLPGLALVVAALCMGRPGGLGTVGGWGSPLGEVSEFSRALAAWLACGVVCGSPWRRRKGRVGAELPPGLMGDMRKCPVEMWARR